MCDLEVLHVQQDPTIGGWTELSNGMVGQLAVPLGIFGLDSGGNAGNMSRARCLLPV